MLDIRRQPVYHTTTCSFSSVYANMSTVHSPCHLFFNLISWSDHFSRNKVVLAVWIKWLQFFLMNLILFPLSDSITLYQSANQASSLWGRHLASFYFVVVVLGFTTLLTSQVICVAFYNEREKSDKFCSVALISAWGSFMFSKSTTREPRLYLPSERSHSQDFYALKNSIKLRPDLNPQTSDPVASVETSEFGRRE